VIEHTAAGHVSFESGSNATLKRAEQPLKQSSRSFSTEDGIQIEESVEQCVNSPRGINEGFEPDSNMTVERDAQSAKQ
jgi:hypothetical protein